MRRNEKNKKMRVKKNREQVLALSYLNKKDIQTLFRISYQKACKIFDDAKAAEKKSSYELYEYKVPAEIVYRMTGKNYNLLEKQIHNEKQA